MANITLLKCNLAVESDLQNFIGFVLSTVHSLGGNAFAATPATMALAQCLRTAGAGSGYPLPVELRLKEDTLYVGWNDHDDLRMSHLNPPPSPELIDEVRQYLRQSTEINDPSLLLKRNAEMTRYLNETRARTEKEIEAMQQTLSQKQQELAVTLHQAETDQLTGLLNRRAYDQKLEQAYKRAARLKGETLSLMLFDLDYFKNINDEFGHQYGDEYLQKMAAALLSLIRQDVDFAFRFGGDEFAVLLFANKEVARSKALALLAKMNNKVSIGVVSISAEHNDCTDVRDFIKRADDALYQAKHAGRGRAVLTTCAAGGKRTQEECVPEAIAA